MTSPKVKLDNAQQFAMRHSLLAMAMRSGEYTPTQYVLMNEAGEVCATGLASLVAEQMGAPIIHRLIDLDLNGTLVKESRVYRFESTIRTYDGMDHDFGSCMRVGSASHMILEVQEFYGWSTPHGMFNGAAIHEYNPYFSLVEASDKGVPFSVLADWIEEGRVR